MASVVLLSRDLMLLTRAQTAAQAAGLDLSNADSAAKAIELAAGPDCRGVVIDLRQPDLQIGDLVRQLRLIGPRFIVACCPHVHEASLSTAREAGCDIVATRGQFERDANAILARMVAD